MGQLSVRLSNTGRGERTLGLNYKGETLSFSSHWDAQNLFELNRKCIESQQKVTSFSNNQFGEGWEARTALSCSRNSGSSKSEQANSSSSASTMREEVREATLVGVKGLV